MKFIKELDTIETFSQHNLDLLDDREEKEILFFSKET